MKNLLELCALMALFCGPAAAVEFSVAKLSRATVTRWVTLPGEVKAYQQAALGARVSGYVTKVKADLGDEVKSGDVLAEIDVPELAADQARLKAELDLAQLEFSRTSDAARRAPDLVVTQAVDTAKGKLEVAKANVQRNEAMLGFAKVTAPFDGTVTKRSVDPGVLVAAGSPAPLFTLVDSSKARLQFSLPENESSFVKKEQPVIFTVEALPGKKFEATVTRFAGALENASKTLLVECEVDNAKRDLRPGAFATVKAGLETHKDVPAIPVEGLVMEKLVPVCFLFKDGKAKRTLLKTGFNDGKNVEVLEGIGADDQVLLVGSATVTDGQSVTVKEAKP